MMPFRSKRARMLWVLDMRYSGYPQEALAAMIGVTQTFIARRESEAKLELRRTRRTLFSRACLARPITGLADRYIARNEWIDCDF